MNATYSTEPAKGGKGMSDSPHAALITGGSRGLGRAIATQMGAEGWRIGLLSRSASDLEAATMSVNAHGGACRGFRGDVLRPEELATSVEEFRIWCGPLDEFALVCCAGRFRGIGPIGTVDPKSWWLDVETAIRGTYQTIEAALPLFEEIRNASISILVGPGHNGELANGSGYATAQAGLVRLVESLAKEFKSRKLPIYAVNPGLAPTPMIQHLLESGEGRQWLPRFTEAFAEGKEVGPEVVAEMVAWLSRSRPAELSGRVVSAMVTPEILEMRLPSITKAGAGLLRLT